MTAFERYGIEAIICALLIFGIVTYLEHRGAAKVEAADAKIVAQQQTHNALAEATQKAQDSQAETDLEKIPPVDPGSLPASLHASCPSVVPKARPASSAGDYRPDIRTAGATAVVQPEWSRFELGDVQSGRDADAEIIYLQTLLKNQYALCAGTP